MNPETPQNPREEIEVRITALLMGELSADEAATLQTQIASDPELTALHARLGRAVELLREASAMPEHPVSAPVQLSSVCRERLLAHFKSVALAPARVIVKPPRDWKWIVPLGLAAVLTAMLGVGVLWDGSERLLKVYNAPPDFAADGGPVGSDTAVLRAPAEAMNASAAAAPELPTALPSTSFAMAALPAPAPPVAWAAQAGVIRQEQASVPIDHLLALNEMKPTESAPDAPSPTPAPEPYGLSEPLSTAGRIALPKIEVITASRATASSASRLARAVPAPSVAARIDPSAPFVATTSANDPRLASLGAQPAIEFEGSIRYGSPIAGPSPAGDVGEKPIMLGDVLRDAPAKASDEQPDGRAFFWSDGDSSKRKINTASEGTFSAVPAPQKPAQDSPGEARGFGFGGGLAGQGISNKTATDTLSLDGTSMFRGATTLNAGTVSSGGTVDASRGSEVETLARKIEPQAAVAADAGNWDRGTSKQADGGFKNKSDFGNTYFDTSALQPEQREKAVKTPDVFAHYNFNLGSKSGGDAEKRDLKLADAESSSQAGRSDLAFKRTELGFNSDPENAAARQLQERINVAKNDSESFASNKTRTRSVEKSEYTLSNPVRTFGETAEPSKPASAPAPVELAKNAEGLVRETESEAAGVAGAKAQDRPQPMPLESRAKTDPSGEDRLDRSISQPVPHEYRRFRGPAAAENLYQSVDELALKRQPVEAKRGELKPALKELSETDAPARTPALPAPLPQPEILTSANAFSTFSLNVSDVAFKLAAASLEQGKMPEPANVRSEEFINAFDYRDPEPAAGAALACATETARYPFAQNRDLFRCSVKTAAAGRQPGRALNLVLLLDNSGSMERADRVRILHEALRVLSAQLQPQDKLSVVTFARTPRLWADGVAGDKAGEVTARVGEITPQGGTNIAAALDLGYATARRHFQPGSVNRVVLLTDGAANLGDVNAAALEKKVEAHRQQGIALDCFGIGWEGFNDTLLEQLSRHGDGRYGFINTPEEAATEFAAQLAGALRVAASDVKVQVEFNPRRVTAYRQIGYAKHQLKKEQFRDNTVDAAEIGAAESGNALYVLEVNPRGEGDLATVRVRFKIPGTTDYREHEWPVPFSKDTPPLEQATPALRLAGTASAFSEMLAASPFAAEVTSDRLLGLLNGVPAAFGADPRPQKLEWMIRQAKSLSGR